MGKATLSAGSGALFLTVLGTVSQLLSFGYRVALSRMVGAEVMGLYQLIMPVCSVLLSVTAVGLTSAVSNLTSQYLALGNRLGAASPTIGIIMLSAKTQEMDKVSGLMLGADDYITKPFSPSELLARVDAVYRRVTMVTSQQTVNRNLTSGPFVLSPKSRTLTKNGLPVDLTQVEFQIMELFLKNKNTALARAAILDEVWGDHYDGDIKIVDVNIRRLRMKVEDEPSSPKYIQTVWGYGYKWTEN